MRAADVVFLLLGVAIVMLVAAGPRLVRAAECITPADIAETISGTGGYVVDLIDVPGRRFDQVLVFVADGDIGLALSREGCIVVEAIRFAPAAEAARS